MHLFKFALAALPALALATEPDPAPESTPASSGVSSTVTETSVTTLIKTIVLSRISTVTSTAEVNGLSTAEVNLSTGSVGSTSYSVMPTGAARPSTAVPSSPHGLVVNAAGSLDATRVTLAALAAMLAVAMF